MLKKISLVLEKSEIDNKFSKDNVLLSMSFLGLRTDFETEALPAKRKI